MAQTARDLASAWSDRLAEAERNLAAAIERLDAARSLEPGPLETAVEAVAGAQAAALEALDQELARGLGQRLGQVARALAAGRDEAERFDRVTLALEGARQLLRHHEDGPALWRERSPRELLQWLSTALEGISQAELAGLLGVSAKTVYRWQSGATTAGGGDEDRLRSLAALVAQLRGTLTGSGILRWLKQPRAAGSAPLAVLADPALLPGLLHEAAALRG